MQHCQGADCVTVQLCSINGVQQALRFSRNASLGEMQKKLCSTFSQQFPIRQATLVVDGRAYNDFLDKPLAAAKENESVSVLFSATTNMFHIDRCWPRMTKAKTFEEDMSEP